MTNQEREELAVQFKHNGRNCCQATMEALTCDDPAFDDKRELISNIGAGFRTGMGCLEATCGALIGAGIVAGIKTEGQDTAKLTARMMREFTELSGANICKVLKSKRPDGSFVCDCDDCVRHAVRVYQKLK